MTIDLLYGRSTLPVRPPAGCVPTVIEKRAMPVLAEPPAAVARALAEPVGNPALPELARGKRTACILICDITRPVPNGLFLSDAAALTGVERVTDLTTAIAGSMARHRDPRVAFVPEGLYVVPVHEEA